MKFPFSYQLGAMDCGPTCLKMIAEYYGQRYAIEFLRGKCNITRTGVSMLDISDAAESIGLQCNGVKMDLEKLKEVVQEAPVILHWNKFHFAIVYKAPRPDKDGKFYVADPNRGLVTYKENEFTEYWMGNQSDQFLEKENNSESDSLNQLGYALLLKPSPSFYDHPIYEGFVKKNDLSLIRKYFTPHKKTFLKLLAGMVISSGIMLLTPFLTRALVDRGINLHDINFIYLILIGQLILFAGSSLTDLIRSNLLLHMGTRIYISMVSNFLTKILKLPISFFEKHITGDLIQRMHDHHRIENILTLSSLNTVFSILNFLVLSVVLAVYNIPVFLIFMLGAILGLGWTILFLIKRSKIDFKFFELYSTENNRVFELLSGITDIKISNSMDQKRREWEKIQSQLYKLKIKFLKISQFQNIGSAFFKQGAAIFITFIAARSVINGHISLGTMFAITMIVGQLSNPLEQLLEMVNTWQDAKLGLGRINDALHQKDEDSEDEKLLKNIPDQESITLENITYGYGSEKTEPVLKNICIKIPAGKVTAIVGASGSGKTTLLKLLLKFYNPQKGAIYLGRNNFSKLHNGALRKKCGVVMQEGKIFNGTIAYNIALGNEMNSPAIIRAAQVANVDEFINSLPRQFSTEIGIEGMALSSGQVQRILLARAVYKNPSYLFLDEATSCLDANNEKAIIENLQKYFKGKTVVIIAHRLSTVKYADQVIVLDKGEVVETGSHFDLTQKKGKYYTLVKNQLEIEA